MTFPDKLSAAAQEYLRRMLHIFSCNNPCIMLYCE